MGLRPSSCVIPGRLLVCLQHAPPCEVNVTVAVAPVDVGQKDIIVAAVAISCLCVN